MVVSCGDKNTERIGELVISCRSEAVSWVRGVKNTA